MERGGNENAIDVVMVWHSASTISSGRDAVDVNVMVFVCGWCGL